MYNIIFLGDVVGKVGRRVLRQIVPTLREKYQPEMLIANGENAAGGLGLDPATADEIYGAGIDFITTGNHVWSKKPLIPYLKNHSQKLIRPANFAPGAPGKGWAIWKTPSGIKVGVLNLIGRVYTGELVDCPFRFADAVLDTELSDVDVVLIDFHAEATSEKISLGYHLDGRVQILLGTHTHVQTADERLLPKGTAYITDVGMCGGYDSVIGVKVESIVERFKSGLPTRFETAKGEGMVNGVVFSLDDSHKVISIERINERVVS